MTVLNTGASKKFTEGWDAIFGRKKAGKKPSQPGKRAAPATKPSAVKKSAKKSPAKKKASR